jgi:hypothetical protein
MGFVQRLDRLTLTELDRAVARDTNQFSSIFARYDLTVQGSPPDVENCCS